MTTENEDLLAFDAIESLFGYTPDTVEGKVEQLNLALSAGDPVMFASALFDQARDCGVPHSKDDERADSVFPYPDLAPFGNHGLAQAMEALEHLGMELVVRRKV
jgi:hypothetical protein